MTQVPAITKPKPKFWVAQLDSDNHLIGWVETEEKPEAGSVFFDHQPDNATDGRYVWSPDKKTFEVDQARCLEIGDTAMFNQQVGGVLAGWIAPEDVSSDVMETVRFIRRTDPKYSSLVKRQMTIVKKPRKRS